MLGITGCEARRQSAQEIGHVIFRSSGCFSQVYEELRLIKTGRQVIATLKSREKIQQARLGDRQLRAFQLFIEQLKSLEEVNGCTTVTTYEAVIDHEVIKKRDAGCVWNGYYELRQLLFR